ncbi:MGMT family protein [Streptomyces sp. NPDC048155]|uniref:MGMT family protein n=1 Tax=Streptomyces sp. NPDC048155 TaxID=3154818 RepID=UPI0033E9D769
MSSCPRALGLPDHAARSGRAVRNPPDEPGRTPQTRPWIDNPRKECPMILCTSTDAPPGGLLHVGEKCANPLTIIRPFHRVSGADGSPAGRAGGMGRTRRPLLHEGASQDGIRGAVRGVGRAAARPPTDRVLRNQTRDRHHATPDRNPDRPGRHH